MNIGEGRPHGTHRLPLVAVPVGDAQAVDTDAMDDDGSDAAPQDDFDGTTPAPTDPPDAGGVDPLDVGDGDAPVATAQVPAEGVGHAHEAGVHEHLEHSDVQDGEEAEEAEEEFNTSSTDLSETQRVTASEGSRRDSDDPVGNSPSRT